jgi:predicted phage tail protein
MIVLESWISIQYLESKQGGIMQTIKGLIVLGSLAFSSAWALTVLAAALNKL